MNLTGSIHRDSPALAASSPAYELYAPRNLRLRAVLKAVLAAFVFVVTVGLISGTSLGPARSSVIGAHRR